MWNLQEKRIPIFRKKYQSLQELNFNQRFKISWLGHWILLLFTNVWLSDDYQHLAVTQMQ